MFVAELFYLLSQSFSIRILIKSEKQRRQDEQERVENGLRREILCDFLMFVPISAILLYTLASPWIPFAVEDKALPILGLASYGFPFATLKTIIVRHSLKVAKQFAEIIIETEKNKKEAPES
ncbi:hypothetical protein [Cerasicoccus frondis]|uniref:hypothetical protein n=1 Tax=Cerasicoccus frondis TaxID=490090 RepID=UPI002852AAE1|nr:hypothetical protein [Cerasicoccus frondis]